MTSLNKESTVGHKTGNSGVTKYILRNVFGNLLSLPTSKIMIEKKITRSKNKYLKQNEHFVCHSTEDIIGIFIIKEK